MKHRNVSWEVIINPIHLSIKKFLNFLVTFYHIIVRIKSQVVLEVLL